MGQSMPDGLSEGGRSNNRMHDLGIVLERLWKFYEAMRSGRPLNDSDEMLAQVRIALHRSDGKSASPPPQENESPRVAFGSLPST